MVYRFFKIASLNFHLDIDSSTADIVDVITITRDATKPTMITRIKKILGGVINERINHTIAKLENGCYAVGRLTPGQTIEMDAQFETLNDAFDHWLSTLPLPTLRT